MKRLRVSLTIVSIFLGLVQMTFSQTFLKISAISSTGGFTTYSAGVTFWVVGQPLVGEAFGSTTLLGSGFLSNTLFNGPTTDVEESDATLPVQFALSQNYPNPFNPSTTIAYELPKRSVVTIAVFNILGQLVSTLINEERDAGRHRVLWNGRAEGGIQASSGVYFYRIYARSLEDVTDFTATKKLILLR